MTEVIGWSGGSPILFIDLLHNSTNALRYFELNHLTWGRNGPTLFLSIGRPPSCTDLFHLDATSMISPCAAPFLLGTSARVFRPKPENRPPVVLRLDPPNCPHLVLRPKTANRPPMVLRPKPLNRPRVAYSIRVPRNSTCVASVLDRPAAQSSRASARVARPPSWLGQHGHSHVHLCLSMSPDVSHRGWSSCLLVPQSKPHVHPSPLSVYWYGTSLLDLHLSIDHRLRAPHLRTTSLETCCTTQLTPWLVHKLNPRRESRWQSLITNLNH
jgi:hypothetical protein